MILGRVIGEIYSTINHPFYESKRLMIVERTRPDGHPAGGYVIAVDVVDAGPGEPVLVLDEGNSARQVFGSANDPVRSVIVGIIDRVQVGADAMERATGIEPV